MTVEAAVAAPVAEETEAEGVMVAVEVVVAAGVEAAAIDAGHQQATFLKPCPRRFLLPTIAMGGVSLIRTTTTIDHGAMSGAGNAPPVPVRGPNDSPRFAPGHRR